MWLPANRTPESSAREKRSAYVLILVCSLVYIPFLLNKDIYWDDWSAFWTFWVDGPSKSFQYYYENSHAGHWLPAALLWELSGGYAGGLGRACAIIFHVANAFLFYRIFNQIKLTSDIAVWIAALHCLSPFYYARGVMILWVYDLFLFCYLVSIWLLRSQRRLAHLAALSFFVLSLGHETFMFLEPLRVLFVHQMRKDYRTTILTCAPFWVIAFTFAVLRMTLLKPYGHYAEYNQLNLDILITLKVLVGTILFYFRAMWFNVGNAWDLSGPYGTVAVLLAALVAALVLSVRGSAIVPPTSATLDRTIRRIVLGVILALLGAVPYILIGRNPHVYWFSSRLAIISIPGVLICLASVIAFLPGRFVRAYTLVMVLAISGLSSLQVTKWYLYESLVRRDLVMQICEMTSDFREKPIRLILSMTPKSPDVLLLWRRFEAYELGVPVNMLRDPSWPLVFIQERSFLDEVTDGKSPRGYCTLSGQEFYPCPKPAVNVHYRLHQDKSSVYKMGFLELLKPLFRAYSSPPGLGALSLTDGVEPPPRAEPDSRQDITLRPGGKIALSILGIAPGFLRR